MANVIAKVGQTICYGKGHEDTEWWGRRAVVTYVDKYEIHAKVIGEPIHGSQVWHTSHGRYYIAPPDTPLHQKIQAYVDEELYGNV